MGANDLSEIASAGSGKTEGYVGFIYADGNNIGRQVEVSKSLAEYKEKSRALSRALPRLVNEALARHLQVKPNVLRRQKGGGTVPVTVHPFEIVTIGGDDLLLIVPGDRALAIARDICAGFATDPELADLFDRPTLSAGVVIADCHTPIYFLRDLAEQLLKNAKKRVRDMAEPEGTVDFLILKSQTTLATSLDHQRGRPPLQFTSSSPKEKLVLTGRPYTLVELDRLVESAQTLKGAGMAGSQLQGYRRALRRGRLQASIYFLYQYARAKGDTHEALKQVFQSWQMLDEDRLPPWLGLSPKRDYSRYWTPWADIIEVMEFTPEPRRATP